MAGTSSVQPPAEAVREQLARILASPLFKHSRHYPALLKYVVEQTLEGRTAHLKERALGVEVFGREPNYDTNLDPVVRTSACEVRKRLAQYYQDASHHAELRIELPAGSYVAEVRLAEPGPVSALEFHPPQPAADASPPRILRTGYAAGGLIAAILLMGVAAADLRPRASSLSQFWGPVWNTPQPIMLCVSPPDPSSAPTSAPTYLDVMHWDRMAFADALTMARIDA